MNPPGYFAILPTVHVSFSNAGLPELDEELELDDELDEELELLDDELDELDEELELLLDVLDEELLDELEDDGLGSSICVEPPQALSPKNIATPTIR